MPPKQTSKDASSGQASRRRTKLQKQSKASRQGDEASAEGRLPMHSDPFQAHAPGDPQAGTAAIHPVTAEALDGAAHKAAELADGVAHHTVSLGERDGALDDPASAMSADDAADTERESVTGAVAAVQEATPIATETPPEPGEATGPRDSAAAGANSEATLTRYNDKVLEIVQGNIAASTALLSALSQAKSLTEAVAINTDHLQLQLLAMTAQGRELTNLAQRLGLDALKPLAGILQRQR